MDGLKRGDENDELKISKHQIFNTLKMIYISISKVLIVKHQFNL